jgi:hypothetical protein
MRMLLLALLLAVPASAATLQVEVSRNGFTGPIEVAVAHRIEGRAPEWEATKTLAAGNSTLSFGGLAKGLYVVLARGPEPLQRLSAKANVGGEGSTVRLVIPKSKTALHVTLGEQPLGGAEISLTDDELVWTTELETGDDGHFAGALWEPGIYTARVRRDRTAAPHITEVTVSTKPMTIEVPDRHVTGHAIGDDDKPLAGVLILLRSETPEATLTVRTTSAPDGRFEFFGVREGVHTLYARAPSYLHSNDAVFELRGPSALHSADLKLTRGAQRPVRVVDEREVPIANATLFAACDGHVKSTSATNTDGRADVALPSSGSCVIYALPKEGSIAVSRVGGPGNLIIRVPAGSSSLRLALKSEAGDAFSDLWLLMRIDGTVVPPAIARQLATRGLSLVTDAEGSISLAHIPAGTYEFWPYRNASEGQMIYDVAADFAAPISVNVLTGENNATIRFKARW